MDISRQCESCERDDDCDGCITYENWIEDGMSDDFEDDGKIAENNKNQLVYVSSANEKYKVMIEYFKKHPYKFIEYYTGQKLPLWQRIYIDVTGKFKKTDYEKRWIAINKAIKPYIRKR